MADETVIWCEDCHLFDCQSPDGEGKCEHDGSETWYGKDASGCEWFTPRHSCAGKARPQPPDWRRLLSLAEAAEEWQVDESTIRHAIRRGQLIPGYDCQKYGKQWVIDREAMKDRFGEAIPSKRRDTPSGLL